mgnify:CR=1 FL=1
MRQGGRSEGHTQMSSDAPNFQVGIFSKNEIIPVAADFDKSMSKSMGSECLICLRIKRPPANNYYEWATSLTRFYMCE